MNNEKSFREYLKLQELSEKGISSRIYWCQRVEQEFNIHLDDIIYNLPKVQKLRRQIYSCNNFTDRQKRNFPNAIKKYYEFMNKNTLPRLSRENVV